MDNQKDLNSNYKQSISIKMFYFINYETSSGSAIERSRTASLNDLNAITKVAR